MNFARMALCGGSAPPVTTKTAVRVGCHRDRVEWFTGQESNLRDEDQNLAGIPATPSGDQMWLTGQESNLRGAVSETAGDTGNPPVNRSGRPERSCTLRRSFGGCYPAPRTGLKMADAGGVEPPRCFNPITVFETDKHAGFARIQKKWRK